MHILIIPSEEFVPAYNKLDGIFQYHQAVLLKESGHRIGVLSMQLNFSLPMIGKGVFFKLVGKKAGNATDDYSASYLLKLGWQKFIRPQKFITTEIIDELTVYRIDGLFYRPPVNNKNHVSWIKAGMICFRDYLEKEGRPDVIHAHNAIYAGMLAQRIYEEYGIKYIVTEHSSTYALNGADERILTRVKQAYNAASGLFAVSEAFANLLNQLFSFQRFHYLPNVLDRHLEKQQYQHSKPSTGKFVFLNIAGLLPVKDHETLLNAYQEVLSRNPKTELWIAGGGELRIDLTAQAKRLKIDHAVKFLGVLNRDEVIDRIKNCDCFVLSSKYETFGVVVIEAMLFGKPVIVTRCGVGQSIVNEKIGFVTDVGNVKQLAGAMSRMTGLTANFEPEYIRDFTIRHFGGNTFVKRMNEIYLDVVENKN